MIKKTKLLLTTIYCLALFALGSDYYIGRVNRQVDILSNLVSAQTSQIANQKSDIETITKSLKKPVDFYIAGRHNFSSDPYGFSFDPTKRNLYIILQEHYIDFDSIPKEAVEKSIKDTLENQVSIYRIIEHLHKNENLELIVAEGQMHDNFDDVKEEIESSLKYSDPDTFEWMESLSDEKIGDLISETRLNGDWLVGHLYNSLKLIGFEEPETAGTDSLMREYLGMDENGDIDPDKARKGHERFLRDIKIRSANALKYALQHSDNLYEKGIIKNKDVALIIGVAHFPDYEKIADDARNGKTDYNLTLIFPKGNRVYERAKNKLDISINGRVSGN